MVHVSKVGHVVLRVQDLDRSVAFYSGVLGLTEVARRDFGSGPMAFLSSGDTHHDIALVETGRAAGPGENGLHHFALKVGDSLEELGRVRSELEAAGVTIHDARDHRVSQGIYLSDPDGNLIELFVDDDAIWRRDPAAVATSDPLRL
jgi:catechol 2,3-dioxygenase